VKKWGSSLVLVFSKEYAEIMRIEEGDIIEIPDKRINIIKPKKEVTPDVTHP